LYFSFVQSYVSYACIAWASTNKTKLYPLHRRQKHALRVISFQNRMTHSAPLFLDIKALSIFKLNIYSILCLVYKSVNSLCPPVFNDLSTKKPPNKYSLRIENKLYEPMCKTKFSQFGIFYRGPHLWNKIIIEGNDISKYRHYPLFQSKLKKVLLSLENEELYF
jgi:hypothetical protein